MGKERNGIGLKGEDVQILAEAMPQVVLGQCSATGKGELFRLRDAEDGSEDVFLERGDDPVLTG